MKRLRSLGALIPVIPCVAWLAFLPPEEAKAQSAQVVSACGTPNGTYAVGQTLPITQDPNAKQCINGTFSSTVTGFRPTNFGTPIVATTGGVTGSLPTNAGEVVATNVGTINGAYCALGASATTSSQYIAPNGGWFAFAISSDSQLTCITSTGTTTVNMAGGSGIPTGTGGGGGGSSSGSNAPYNYTDTGFVPISTFSTSTGFSAPALSIVCVVVVEGNPVRYRMDGTAPTAVIGMLLPLGATLLVTSNNFTSGGNGFHMIPTTGASTADVDCLK